MSIYYRGKKLSEAITIFNSGGSSGATGTPIEISTAAEMNAVLVAANIGKVYKYVGTTDGTYTYGRLYYVVEV